MSDEDGKIIHVIPHTHWDREWYVPFQNFRFRLVRVLDETIRILRERPEFPHFNLDGQTVVLEDYLEIRPECREELLTLIGQGRIGIGPWYVQSSPWLQTGEGLLRNLLVGIGICQEFGASPVNVGYIPDQFVMPPQLPQILRIAGIEHAAFGRGVGNQLDGPDARVEFWWEALDGSKVLTFFLSRGYGLNANLEEDAEIALNRMIMDHSGGPTIPSASNLVLSFHGSDHCGPQEVILDAIPLWNDEEELVEEFGQMQLSSWEAYLREFKHQELSLPTQSGEFQGCKHTISMHGIFSSRMPFKQRNYWIHDLLTRYAEPFSAIAALVGVPIGCSPPGFLKTAWRWLLKNQAHDSSWCASVDQVESEMWTRFDWAEQIASEVFRRGAQAIMQHIKPVPDVETETTTKICVFNPLPFPRTEAATITCTHTPKGRMVLRKADGTPVAASIVATDPGGLERYQRRVYVGSHGGLGGPWYKIIFLAELPALGWATYYLCDGDGSDEPEEVFVEAFDSYLQNDVVRVDVQPNGALRVTDRSSGHIYSNINLLEDMADLGDGWEFGPLPADEPINSLQVEARSVLRAATPAYSELHVSYELAIPESLAEGRTARATEEVLLPVDVFIRLLPGNDPAVYIETRIRNVACDHCVRALFPTGVRADTIAVNGHFGVLHRPTEPPSTKGWKHPWVMNQTQPFHQWVSVFDAAASAGAALLTKGLPAYEIEKTGEDAVVLALVLYRATGQWGHHLTVRPPVLTPDAQLFDKELTFEYAFVPQSISWDQAGVSRLAQRLNAPIHLEEDYDAFRLKVQPKNKCLPPISSLLSIGVPEVVLSALMLAGESTLLVRVYNISPNEMLCPIRCGFPFKTVQLVNALREVLPSQEELVQTGEEQELALTIGPSRIATLEFTF